MKKPYQNKISAKKSKVFEASLGELVKFAQGEKAKVKVENLFVKTKGHTGK